MDQDFEPARQALAAAAAPTSYKALHRLMEISGLALSITSDALGRFGTGQTKTLSVEKDLKNLRKFLFSTETGRLLRAISGEPLSAYDRVVGSLKVHLPANRAERVNGHYFCFHGSISDKRQFTVRLLQVQREDNAVVSIKSFVRAKDGQPTPAPSEGFLVYDRDEFQILMLHRDDIIALNLIVPYKADPPREGVLTSMWGQMLGLTAANHLFSRLMRIDRIPHGMKPEDALARTGHFFKPQLPKDFSEIFQELAENRPEQYIPDPVLNFANMV
jgi:hypothetical protein